jgi:hypothetical protein
MVEYASIELLREYGNEDDYAFLILDPDLKTENGWLSPDGFLYACRYIQHNNLQFALEQQKGIADLEQAGWVKLLTRTGESDHWYWDFSIEPTQAQINVIHAWCEKHEKPLPYDFRVTPYCM